MSVLSAAQAVECARAARTVAVLGIKPERFESQPSFFVPQFVQKAGKKLIPVPVLPGFDTVLGEPVQRDLTMIREQVDILDVFRPGKALPSHIQQVLAMEPRPRTVWLQIGIRNTEFEEAILAHGIDLVIERCLKIDLQDANSKL